MKWPAVDLVWPTTIIRPRQTLIYLDLNHWINLGKAARDKASAYSELLEACRRALAADTARFVLSSSFMAEFSTAVGNPRQRDEIIPVIEELTGFNYLCSPADVAHLELQAFLDLRTNTVGPRLNPIPLVGKSMLHAFGMVGGLRIHDERTGEDITERLRTQQGQSFSDRLGEMELWAERELLRGPSDEAIPDLRAKGYQPEMPRQRLADNAAIEQAFADQHLDHHWRKGRLADVLAARHVSLELIDMLNEELIHRGIALPEVFANFSNRLELPLALPSSSVVIGMKGHYHRNSQRRWSINDLYDIGALSLAVPYCDVVFTDAEARSALTATGQGSRMGTKLPRTPSELASDLDALN